MSDVNRQFISNYSSTTARIGKKGVPNATRANRHEWFEVMRKCGDEVREILHDGCPVSCLGDAPFGYVNVFTSHVKVGFFHGVATPDPAHLLQGAGKFMHHVKLRPEWPQTPHRLASSSRRRAKRNALCGRRRM